MTQKMCFQEVILSHNIQIFLYVDSLLTPELDLFALETKTRKMVHDLLAPMIEKMNHERGRMN
jgi:hypothetical protein